MTTINQVKADIQAERMYAYYDRMWRCKFCDRWNPEGSPACEQCGCWICPDCGEQVDVERYQRCPKCGGSD